MTSNQTRAATLLRTLRAGIERDWTTLEELCTDDVRAWTPARSTASLAELRTELDRRDDVFSQITLDAAPLDVGGDYACVEWTVEMTHSGRLELAAATSIDPTGLRITLHGSTVAEFRGDQICSVRQYWDASEVLVQLGAAAVNDGPDRA